MMTTTRNLARDLASLEETILLIDADITSDPAVKARLIENVGRTIERLQDVEFLVPGLYDYSGTNPFLLSVRDQVHLGQRRLTQKQIDAARRSMPVAKAPKVEAPSVNEILRTRELNALEVVRNSGRVRLAARLDPYSKDDPAYGLHIAVNAALGKCPDGCCGGSEMHGTYLSWVKEVELLAASLIEEDAA